MFLKSPLKISTPSFIVIALLLSSCASRKKTALFTAPSDAVIDTLKTVYVANNQGPEDLYYKIKAGDQVAVRNLQNLEFGAQGTATGGGAASISYLVDNDGRVNLPVIGKTSLAGLNRREATAKLQELYSQTLKDPIIELQIVNLKVTVLGEFKTNGNFLIERDNTTLVDMLGETGGLTDRADPRTLKIIRGKRSNPEIIYVNLKDINSLASAKLALQNNDIIYAEPKKIYANQEGFRNALTFIQPLFLVLNTIVLIYNLTR